MNYNDMKNWLSGELERLDISPSNYKKAVERYNAIGKMLEQNLKDQYNVDCHVYAQGSFMLGTVVKPFGKEKEYDVDLVCECNYTKEQIEPKELKQLIGKVLKENGTYSKMLDDEGRRTWTINYSEDNALSFHIDIQPSIPNTTSEHKDAIFTTSKTKSNGEYSWDNGNPLGLKQWFEDIKATSYNEIASIQKRMLFENNTTLYASVDDIPEQLVMTKLQRLVQLLKRHRDIRFENNENQDDKPNSMIITILATQVFLQINYNLSLIDLLKEFADKISMNVNILKANDADVMNLFIHRVNGEYSIPNPTVEENLAERWNQSDNKKKDAFFQWSEWILSDAKRFKTTKALKESEEKSFDMIIKEFSALPLVQTETHGEPKELANKPQPWKENA